MTQEARQEEVRVPAARMVVVLGLTAMVAGLLVVLAEELTAPYIAANRAAALDQALDQVLPASATRLRRSLTDAGLAPAGAGGTPVHLGYDADGRLTGIALEGTGQGYAGPVRVLWSWDPDCRCTRGMRVLEMRETPGLGDRIITDPEFQANFDGLAVRPAPDGDGLAHPVVTVKHGAKDAPWEIDAVSGATVSSVAVGQAIHRSASAALPRLVPHLEELAELQEPAP
jgi:electron transport complex protein RnfG